MKIVVLVKHVPEPTATWRFAANARRKHVKKMRRCWNTGSSGEALTAPAWNILKCRG